MPKSKNFGCCCAAAFQIFTRGFGGRNGKTVDTRIKAWQSLFPSTRITSRQCLKLPLYPHKVISKSNGGRESCITKVARSHNPASILGIICTSRWRGGREFELSATEIEWEESGPVDDSEMSLAGADFSGRERERGCLALAEL